MLPLLAEPAQPMLADEAVETALLRLAAAAVGGGGCSGDVTLRAARAVGACTCLKGAAYGAVGREADLVGLAEERREAEAVCWSCVVEDGRGRGLGRRRGRHGGFRTNSR